MPLVPNPKADKDAIAAQRYFNRLFVGVFDGIRDEIVRDLFQRQPVPGSDNAVFNGKRQARARRCRDRLIALHRRIQQVREVCRLKAEALAAGDHSRDVEELVGALDVLVY